MPLYLSWTDLVVRLGSTLIAGAIIGYNRGEHGKAAGLRTTLLVCLAASVAMMQVNWLLPLSGRSSDSFVMNDLMRLPLGILTGVGFIGAGAILRRRELIIGVTTAATLWYVTVLGLCFGGGQILLGWIATAIGCFVLWGLKRFELWMAMEFRYRLSITMDGSGPPDDALRAQLRDAGLIVRKASVAIEKPRRKYDYEVVLVRPAADTSIPSAVDALDKQAGVVEVRWQEVG